MITGSVVVIVLGSIIADTNRLVLAHWSVLLGSVALLAGLVSVYSYIGDKRLPLTTEVSAEPVDGDVLVSVLVPAWNEGDTLDTLIEAFQTISYSHREMILCAGGDDDTYERAAAAEGEDAIHVIKQSADMNKQAALNACLERATGDVLYLIDGDCVLDDETWNAALRPMIEDNETVVAGTSRPLNEQWGALFPTYQHLKEEFERAHRPRYVRGLLGRNAVVRREAMDDLGGFDESIQAGTDYNLAKRLLAHGHDIRFVPNSRIQSEYPTSIRGYFNQQSRWLRNVFFLGRKWEAHDEAWTTVRTCGIGTAMIAVPVLGLTWFPLLLGWVGLASYSAFSRLRWVLFFRRERSQAVPVRVILASVGLMFIEFASWAYALIELVTPSRRRKW